MKFLSPGNLALFLALLSLSACLPEADYRDEFPDTKDYQKFFSNSYEEAKQKFRRSVELTAQRLKLKNLEFSQIKVPSQKKEKLSIDFLYIPPQKRPEKNKSDSALLMISSGVHGIEAFVGSAAQLLFLEKLLQKKHLQNNGFLLLHGINPYGFKHLRRVTENNVDLNRNSDIDKSLYSRKNPGYARVREYLDPQKQYNASSIHEKLFLLNAMYQIIRYGQATLRQAVLQGQYEFEKGIYFGGKKREAQIETIYKKLPSYLKKYGKLLLIDMHTGYGERGTLHLFPNPPKDKDKKVKLEKLFHGYRIDWGDSDDFYTVTGDFSDFIGKIFKKNSEFKKSEISYYPMTFEYGTLDSQNTAGSLRSIRNMIRENQGYHHGYADLHSKEISLYNFREMFYPSSTNWRNHVMHATEKIYSDLIDRFFN